MKRRGGGGKKWQRLRQPSQNSNDAPVGRILNFFFFFLKAPLLGILAKEEVRFLFGECVVAVPIFFSCQETDAHKTFFTGGGLLWRSHNSIVSRAAKQPQIQLVFFTVRFIF